MGKSIANGSGPGAGDSHLGYTNGDGPGHHTTWQMAGMETSHWWYRP